MLRIGLGVFVGFLAWGLIWFGGETVLSSVWPAFGEHQAAFQSAIENGGTFAPNSTMLLTHVVLATVVSLIAGFLSALIAGENKRAPLILGFMLVGLGVLKAAMSWQLVPVWYHILFILVLLPMAMFGARIR